jgi:hypothetical protein
VLSLCFGWLPIQIITQDTSALLVHSARAKPQLTLVTLDSLQENEVLVEMHATGVCPTDLGCLAGHLPAQFLTVSRHEGRVQAQFVLSYNLSDTLQVPELSPEASKIKSYSTSTSAVNVDNTAPGILTTAQFQRQKKRRD